MANWIGNTLIVSRVRTGNWWIITLWSSTKAKSSSKTNKICPWTSKFMTSGANWIKKIKSLRRSAEISKHFKFIKIPSLQITIMWKIVRKSRQLLWKLEGQVCRKEWMKLAWWLNQMNSFNSTENKIYHTQRKTRMQPNNLFWNQRSLIRVPKISLN